MVSAAPTSYRTDRFHVVLVVLASESPGGSSRRLPKRYVIAFPDGMTDPRSSCDARNKSSLLILCLSSLPDYILLAFLFRFSTHTLMARTCGCLAHQFVFGDVNFYNDFLTIVHSLVVDGLVYRPSPVWSGTGTGMMLRSFCGIPKLAGLFTAKRWFQDLIFLMDGV